MTAGPIASSSMNTSQQLIQAVILQLTDQQRFSTSTTTSTPTPTTGTFSSGLFSSISSNRTSANTITGVSSSDPTLDSLNDETSSLTNAAPLSHETATVANQSSSSSLPHPSVAPSASNLPTSNRVNDGLQQPHSRTPSVSGNRSSYFSTSSTRSKISPSLSPFDSVSMEQPGSNSFLGESTGSFNSSFDPPLSSSASIAPPLIHKELSNSISSPSAESLQSSQDAAETSSIISVTQNDQSDFSDGAAIQLNNRGLTSLPSEVIDVMKSSVSKLSLQANKLTTLPKQVRLMEFLTYLDISHNNFMEFPLVLTQCPSLIILDISYNHIQRLPDNIGHLDSLNILSMSHNKFKYMPPAILDMVDLMVIQIDGNPWIYPPKEITQHPGSQAEDQMEWLELLRTYMDDNLETIQNALDSETSTITMAHNTSSTSTTSMASTVSNSSMTSNTSVSSSTPSKVDISKLDSSSIKAPTTIPSAFTTPSVTTANSPSLGPVNNAGLSGNNASPLSASKMASALSIPSNLTISISGAASINSPTPSTPLAFNPADDQSFADMESLRSLLKLNDASQDGNDQQKNTVNLHNKTAEGLEIPEKNRGTAENTQSSRAAKRMGFVVKRPARAASTDSVSSQYSNNVKPGTNGSPAPIAIGSSSTYTAIGHDELAQSNSTLSFASISMENMKLAPPPPLSPEERVGSLGSIGSVNSALSTTSTLSNNLGRSPSKHMPIQSSIASRSHSRQLSHDSIPETDITGKSTFSQFQLSNHTRSSSGDDHLFHRSTHSSQHHSAHNSNYQNNHILPMPSASFRGRSNNINLVRERSHSVSVTSSPEKESATGEYFRRLSTLTEEMKPIMHPNSINSLELKSKESKVYLNLQRKIIITARDILFALVEFQSIMRRCTRLCNDKAITTPMHDLIYTGQSYNDKLVRVLEQEEARLNHSLKGSSSKEDPDDESKVSKASVKTIALACIASIRNFKQMAKFCNENLFRFTSAVDVKFIRCIILVIFGSFNELYNSWNILNEVENPPGYNQNALPVTYPAGYQRNNSSLPSSYIAAGLDNLPLPHGMISSQGSTPTTTPLSGSPSGQMFIHRGSISSTASPINGTHSAFATAGANSGNPNFVFSPEADDLLYDGLEAAATSAKVLLKQLTETLTKTGREMREAQSAPRTQNSQSASVSGNIKNHIKNLSEKCQTGVAVTKKLKLQLDLLKKAKAAYIENGNSGSGNGGTMYLDLPEKIKFWDDMNAFVKGMIGLLTSTRSAINDLPYLKNTSNLATLTKLTKDIPLLMEVSSYKLLISDSKERELGGLSHLGSISGPSGPQLSQPGQSGTQSQKNHPTQIAIPSYPTLPLMPTVPSSVPATIGQVFGTTNTSSFAAIAASGGPATTTSVPNSGPFDHTNSNQQTAYYSSSNYNTMSQFSAPPSTPLAAVLGTTAAALVLPSPPVNKTTHSPFFPQMDSITSSSLSQPASIATHMTSTSTGGNSGNGTVSTAGSDNKSNATANSNQNGHLHTIVTHNISQHAPSLPSPLSGNISSSSEGDPGNGRYAQGHHSRGHSNSNSNAYSIGEFSTINHAYLQNALASHIHGSHSTPAHSTTPSAVHSRNHSNSSNSGAYGTSSSNNGSHSNYGTQGHLAPAMGSNLSNMSAVSNSSNKSNMTSSSETK